MNKFIIIARIMLVPFCIGLTLAILASAAVQLHTQAQDDVDTIATVTDFAKAVRSGETFGTYMTILAYNATERTLLASVYSNSIKQEVPTLIRMDKGFTMMRRDLLITNGVITGSKPTTPASIAELVEGTRGHGLIRFDSDGVLSINFLLIGDPFPRP